MKTKNECEKRRPKENPYEVWSTDDGSWKWYVLKKYQSEEGEKNNPYARWLCFVTSPFCPDGEYGDTYIHDIKKRAKKI